jgi:hypothetical protein
MSDKFSKSLIISTLQMYKQNLYAAHTSVGRHDKTSLITTSRLVKTSLVHDVPSLIFDLVTMTPVFYVLV